MSAKEFNIGDYVRTEYGITQYKEYETTNGNKLLCMPVKDGSNGIFANIEDIIKSSPNIIDLIEVGDYVNGFEVLRIDKECNLYPKTLKCQYPNNIDYFDIFDEDIKSIVTKEQFESMEYKIGE